MSEFLQRLHRQAKELTALERDLRVHPEERIDWGRTTMSSAVVGLGIPVERSFLADYFLTTWTEWRSLYERYPRYFGRPLESMPPQWQQTAYHCRHLADRLFRDGSLGQVLAATWEEQAGETEQVPEPGDAGVPEAAVLYRSMVRNHLRLSALAARETDQRVDDGTWSRCAQVAQRADAHWKGLFFQAPAAIREAVLWHLQHYRHAALALSWLNGASQSTLDHLLKEERPTTFALQGGLPAFNLHSEQAHEVQRVLLRIGQAIAEIGYAYFLEDVTSKDFACGQDSPLGSAGVTLVPGPRQDRLSGIVVGITKGNRNRTRLGFPRVLQQIKALRTEGKGQVVFVLVVGDSWDSARFRSQHLSDLRKFTPIPFLFLLVGSPDRVVTPIAIAGDHLSETV